MRIWRRSFVATFAVAAIASSPAAAQSPKPNIVVMLMDNLGYGELGISRQRQQWRVFIGLPSHSRNFK
jgi:hypothetical protein